MVDNDPGAGGSNTVTGFESTGTDVEPPTTVVGVDGADGVFGDGADGVLGEGVFGDGVFDDGGVPGMVTAALLAEAAEVPTAFVAVTVKVYEVPGVSPETTQRLPSEGPAVHVLPPGVAVTV